MRISIWRMLVNCCLFAIRRGTMSEFCYPQPELFPSPSLHELFLQWCSYGHLSCYVKLIQIHASKKMISNMFQS